jgi:hypothetical protein
MPVETEENHKYYSATQFNLRSVNLSIKPSVPWGSICLITFCLEVRVVVLTKEKSNLLPGFVPNVLQPRESHLIELFWLQTLSCTIMHFIGGV